jgi:tetratricopeptide (TPR) repeat protein
MRHLISIAAIASLTLAAPALAQQAQQPPQNTPEQDEIARRAFESGREAFAQGDYEASLAYFQESYSLSQRHGLLYNIAQSLDRLRRDEDALRTFREYLERVPNSRSRGEVEARIRVLERIIGDRQQSEEARAAAEREAEEARQRREQAEREAQEAREAAQNATSAPPSRPPLHMGIFLATAGVALAGGGLSIWTGLETLSLNDQYRAEMSSYDRASQLYDDGTMYQLVTNVLIGTSAGLAALAVVLAIFTDWGGGEAAPAPSGQTETAWEPLLDLGPDRAAMGARLRF